MGGVFLRRHPYWGSALAGLGAGMVTGLFGAGGGLVLIPLLTFLTDIPEEAVFPCSISIILPICLVTLFATAQLGPLPFTQALPYLAGSALGGFLAGKYGRRVPALWLHRGLGVLILWGGVRYLWN